MHMMCSKCHKRVAVVFVTKIENGETVNEGFCLPCANKLGIKPINDMLSNMGITGQDLDRLSSDVENLLEALPAQTDNGVDGGAPAVDLFRMFNQGGGEGKKTNAEAKKPKEEKFKFLSA